jgi:O-antigen ligase
MATTVPQEDAFAKARGLRPLRIATGAFIAASIAISLTLPEGVGIYAQFARWALLGIACLFCLGNLLRLPLSAQAAAWLASGIYAVGTVIYTIDIPVTVLRSLAFLALTVGAFLAGSICYQGSVGTPHRLPGRIGALLTLLAVPSFAGYLAAYPSWFFQGNLLRGIFCHANALGAFGAMWLVVGVGGLDNRLSRYRRLLLVGPIALAACLLLSRSRAGTGGAAISILLYALLTRQMRGIAMAGMFLATITLSAYVALPSVTEVAMQESGQFVRKGSKDDVLLSRRETWDTGITNFEASPLVGHGFGTSVGEETKEWRLVGLGGREKGNAFIAILEETGILGALVMYLPVVLCVFGGFRIKRLNTYLADNPGELRNDARLAAAFWAGAMGGLVNNLAEATLWSAGSPYGGMLLFLAGASEGLVARTEHRL